MCLRTLLNWLVPSLKPLEKMIINTLAENLYKKEKTVLLKQVKRINMVQRHSECKEVNLYCIKRGKPYFDEELLFPLKEGEIKLATILFQSLKDRKKYSVDFWIVNGRLFSLVFNHSPKHLSVNDIKIEEITVFINPMLGIASKEQKSLSKDALTGWLREWSKKWSITNLREPLSHTQRKKICEQIDIKLPSEYLEIISQTEGLKIDGCLIYGLSEMRDIVTPETNYYILADIEGRGVLAVKRESADDNIYFLSYEDGQAINVGRSFRRAIEQILQNELLFET